MKAGARFVLLASTFVSAWACAQPAMEKPSYVIGDKWQYAWSAADGQTGQRQREVAEIAPNGQVLIRYGGGKTDAYDSAMNFIPDANDPKSERTLKLVAYPLKFGSDWTWKREFPNLGPCRPCRRCGYRCGSVRPWPLSSVNRLEFLLVS